MDDDTTSIQLKLKINLEKFSAIAIAVNLWDYEDIKNDIKTYFGDFKKKTDNRKEWKDIISTVSQHVKQLKLPKDLSNKINDFVISTGYRIYWWNKYLRETLQLLPWYTHKIYWTTHGSVDENKIFQAYWEKNIWFKIKNVMNTPYNRNIIILSCIFTQENFIRKNYKKIKAITECYLAPKKFLNNNCDVFSVISVWLSVYLSVNKQNGMDFYANIKKSNKVASKLFLRCIENEMYIAAKYFWQNLNKSEKINLTYYECVSKVLEYERHSYKNAKITELLIYLMGEMSNDAKNQVISKKFLPLFKNLKEWPHEEIVILIFEKYIDTADDHVLNVLLSETTTNTFSTKYEQQKFVDMELCRQMLPMILKKIPKEVKLENLKYDWDSPFYNLLTCYDASILSTIFNDPDLSDHKDELLQLYQHRFKKLISENLKLLIQFTSYMFFSEIERKEFKLKMNITTELAIEGEFSLADELLDWISDSVEERVVFKNQVDPFDVCLANVSLDIVKGFFLWRYDTDEEREKAKLSMRQSNFFSIKTIKMGCITDDWFDEEYKLECATVLNWLAEINNQSVELKQIINVDEHFLRKFWDMLPKNQYFERTDELLKFLSITEEQICRIKEKLIESKDEWIFTYIVSQKNFSLGMDIVDWVFTNQDRKKQVLGEYINSTNGAFLLLKTLLSCRLNFEEALLHLLNKWVKFYADISVIKKNLELLATNDLWDISGKRTLLILLNSLENGELLTLEEISF